MNKKVFIVPISLVAFLASCATNGALSSNLDRIYGKEDPYTAKLEISYLDTPLLNPSYNVLNYGSGIYEPTFYNESYVASYTTRRYDSHNSVVKEDKYSLLSRGPEWRRYPVNADISNFTDKTHYASSAHIYNYDNDKIVSRVTFFDDARQARIPDQPMPFYDGASAHSWEPEIYRYHAKGYFTETYTYDDQNRLVKKVTDTTTNDDAIPIWRPTYYNVNSTNSFNLKTEDMIKEEEYKYEGNSRDFVSSSVTIKNKAFNMEEGGIVLVTTELNKTEREFDKNGNIIKEESTSSNDLSLKKGKYVTHNTYDEYNCLVNSKTFTMFDGEEPFLSREITTSYYKHDPNKILAKMITTNIHGGQIIINSQESGSISSTSYEYQRCTYDEKDRLKTDLKLCQPIHMYYKEWDEGQHYYKYGDGSIINFNNDYYYNGARENLTIYYYN
ncbi:MAG: hypothetical protein MJ208_03765 [Bacilli bacterium]|nr:hypothetical protein [Bacilli bacterium]